MTNRHRALGVLAACLAVASIATFAKTRTTSTWTDPEMQPRTYAKVLVMARVTEESAKRILEDAVVSGLRSKGINAVAAYQTVTPEDLATEDSIRAKAKALGVDAGLVFTVLEHEKAQIATGPSGSLSVGFGGMYGGFIGGSVPIGGNKIETVHQVVMKGEFYEAGVPKPTWMAQYESDLALGVDNEARSVAKDTVKYLKKAKIFKKPEE
jgi:hypothetical protein